MEIDAATPGQLRGGDCVGADELLRVLKRIAHSGAVATYGGKARMTVGVVGYPNVGKSSVINSLLRSKATPTGDRPGITKCLQTVQLDKVLPTPPARATAGPASGAPTDRPPRAGHHADRLARRGGRPLGECRRPRPPPLRCRRQGLPALHPPAPALSHTRPASPPPAAAPPSPPGRSLQSPGACAPAARARGQPGGASRAAQGLTWRTPRSATPRAPRVRSSGGTARPAPAPKRARHTPHRSCFYTRWLGKRTLRCPK